MGKHSRSRSRSRSQRRRRRHVRDVRSPEPKEISLESRLDKLENLLYKVLHPENLENTQSMSASPAIAMHVTSPLPLVVESATLVSETPAADRSLEPGKDGDSASSVDRENDAGAVNKQLPSELVAKNLCSTSFSPVTTKAPVMVCSTSQGQMNKLLSGSDNIPVFSGNCTNDKMTAKNWLFRLESLGKIFGWDERLLIYHMTSKLSGNARLWFDSQQDIDFSWVQWKEMLQINFPEARGIAAKLYDFVTIVRESNENVLDFYYKKMSLGKKCDQPDHVICDVIIFTLNDPLLKSGARGAACRDTKHLLEYLTDVASDLKTNNTSKNSIDVNKTMRKAVLNQADITCFNCSTKGHFATQCTSEIKRCDRCHKFGHTISECKEEKVCTNCNKLGHTSDICYRSKREAS